MIYLDNAATTNIKPDCVIDAVMQAMRNMSVNAGRGSYALARDAAHMLDECREKLLRLAYAGAGYSVYFSPSATVSLNQIISGMGCDGYSNIYVSPFEHNAVMRPVEALRRQRGTRRYTLPFDRQTWKFDAKACAAAFSRNHPHAVIISMVSNTTGFVLPVAEITALAHNYGAKVVIDCAQAFGSLDADFAATGADAYVFAGHKTLYGPYGAAGMIISDSWHIQPELFGGTGTASLSLEMPPADAGGYEPGSMNIPAICGLSAAADWVAQTGAGNIAAHERRLINLFAEGAKSIERVKLYLPPENFRSGIAAFNVEGYSSHDAGEILDDEFGICVRTGYQCAPLVHGWLDTVEDGGVIRLSVSWFNNDGDIQQMLEALDTL